MKQFFITGSSAGIGKSLAELALAEGYKVTGISRRKTIEHPLYKHLFYDLSDPKSYLKINFNTNHEAEQIILINNAGWLGEVKATGNLHPENIQRAYNINILAPSVLCNMFIQQTEALEKKKMIINISSGAGNYPVSSWSTYCASKAALNLFTEVMQKDCLEIQCCAIAPGVVDTEMQGEIRASAQQDFPDKQRFINYKENGELSNPKTVAEKILNLVYNPDKIPSVVFSLRDVS